MSKIYLRSKNYKKLMAHSVRRIKKSFILNIFLSMPAPNFHWNFKILDEKGGLPFMKDQKSL
jgi:hypothetical protein